MKLPYSIQGFCLLPLTLLLLVIGCSSTPDPIETSSTEKEIFTTDQQIFVGDTVEMSYDPNVIMKRAESFFEKESYAEAIVEYKHFLDLHRNHVLAPYAYYKIGESHFKQYQTVDRDPEPLNQCILAFEKLLEAFPASQYESEAEQSIWNCKERLAQRHLMVGKFYINQESYLAAAHRFEKVIKEYPELESAGDAMFLLAKTYQDLGIEEWTQDWLIAMVKQHPQNPHHLAAQKLLVKLQEQNPTLLASLPKSQPLLENPTNQASGAETTDFIQASSSFSHAGILPTPSTTPTPETTTTDHLSLNTSCKIGTWCDSGSVQSVPPTTSPAQASKQDKSCKAGEWC
ncbi:MAG: outer membrane protein assembly factor BamD [Nitrospirales bacterium]